MNRTLVIVKPDGVARGLVGQILARIEGAGFTVPALVEKLAGPFFIALLVAVPPLVYVIAGSGNIAKYVDNYGIQILIYIMLGWGLNVVVGLAGLLDLGYVAFYAVGAYSYALLAKNFGFSFYALLPLAGILAAFWGILLGFPVLRLRGDYLAIVTLAFGEIIRVVLVNWTDFSNGYAGISSIPRVTFFGIPFTAGDDGFAATAKIKVGPVSATFKGNVELQDLDPPNGYRIAGQGEGGVAGFGGTRGHLRSRGQIDAANHRLDRPDRRRRHRQAPKPEADQRHCFHRPAAHLAA